MKPKPFDADKITLKNWDETQILRCKKKPIIIHAIQMNFPEGFKVTSREGPVIGKQGDYLMFGIEGEKYPCARRIFEKSYDLIQD